MLRLFDRAAGEAAFPVQPLGDPAPEAGASGSCGSYGSSGSDAGTGGASGSGSGSGTQGYSGLGCSLRICVHGSETPAGSQRNFLVHALGCLCLAAALLLGGGKALGEASLYGAVLAVAAAAWLVMSELRAPTMQRQRRVTFSVEGVAQGTPLPAQLPSAVSSATASSLQPLFVGKWMLDKAKSEPYEPILSFMGMHYLIRRMIDAKTSTLEISIRPPYVVLLVRTLVTVEDVMPLDGSFVVKAVPPQTRFKGTMRLHVKRFSATELVLSTILPDNEGELRDTTTVHADGNWFSRRTEVAPAVDAQATIVVNRVFRRVR